METPVPGKAVLLLRGQAQASQLSVRCRSRPGRGPQRPPQLASSQLPRERWVRPVLIFTPTLCFPLKVNIYTPSTLQLQCCRGHQSGREGFPGPRAPEIPLGL